MTPPTHYRGVEIKWDMDNDERILEFLDALPQETCDRLLMVGESKGSLMLIWKKTPTPELELNKEVVVDGDVWVIYESKIDPDYNYQEYINSPVWKTTSRYMRAKRKSCELCGSKKQLQCHHIQYPRDGYSKDSVSNLLVACKRCHKKLHGINTLGSKLREYI